MEKYNYHSSKSNWLDVWATELDKIAEEYLRLRQEDPERYISYARSSDAVKILIATYNKQTTEN